MNYLEYINLLHQEEYTAPRYLERLDEEEASKLVDYLSKSNDKIDIFTKAFLYLDGLYVKEDIDKAYALFQESVNNEIFRAWNNLGIIEETYYENFDKALDSYSKAWIDYHYLPACYNLYTIYENHYHDQAKAMYYLNLYNELNI